MKSISRITLCFLMAIFIFPCAALAQEREQTPEEKKQEKEFYEWIDKEVKRLTESLQLEYWQEFYADSILTHDYLALRDEINDLSKNKISNTDIYVNVQDKWMEQIYNAFHKILNEEQWTKYLKQGAARDKKNRDKRKAKAKK